MEGIVSVAIMSAAVVGLFVWAYHFMSRRRFLQEYEKAEEADLLWYRSHPGCTLDQAHSNRDRVLRKYRY